MWDAHICGATLLCLCADHEANLPTAATMCQRLFSRGRTGPHVVSARHLLCQHVTFGILAWLCPAAAACHVESSPWVGRHGGVGIAYAAVPEHILTHPC